MKKDLFDNSDTLEWYLNFELGKPTERHGYIYPKKVMENALNEFMMKDSRFVIVDDINDDNTTPLEKVVAIVTDYEINNDEVKLFVKTIGIGKNLPDNMTVSTIGIGNLYDGNDGYPVVAEDYSIKCFCITRNIIRRGRII